MKRPETEGHRSQSIIFLDKRREYRVGLPQTRQDARDVAGTRTAFIQPV